jgi:hypothetical protein
MELPTRWMALVCQTAHVRALHCHPSTASRSARVQSCSLLQSRRTPVTTPESHQLMGIRFALANAMAPGPESRQLYVIHVRWSIVASTELAPTGCARAVSGIVEIAVRSRVALTETSHIITVCSVLFQTEEKSGVQEAKGVALTMGAHAVLAIVVVL